MPGLVPGIQPTTCPASASRWIPATPAFAGAGKCRDDMERWCEGSDPPTLQAPPLHSHADLTRVPRLALRWRDGPSGGEGGRGTGGTFSNCLRRRSASLSRRCRPSAQRSSSSMSRSICGRRAPARAPPRRSAARAHPATRSARGRHRDHRQLLAGRRLPAWLPAATASRGERPQIEACRSVGAAFAGVDDQRLDPQLASAISSARPRSSRGCPRPAPPRGLAARSERACPARP